MSRIYMQLYWYETVPSISVMHFYICIRFIYLMKKDIIFVEDINENNFIE